MYTEIFQQLSLPPKIGSKNRITVSEQVSGNTKTGPVTCEVELKSDKGKRVWVRHTYADPVMAPKDGKLTAELREMLYGRLFTSVVNMALFGE